MEYRLIRLQRQAEMKLPTDEEIESDPLLGGLKASDVFGPLKGTPSSEQACGNCRFFLSEVNIDLFNNCVRFPRAEYKLKHQWCGEWKEKE